MSQMSKTLDFSVRFCKQTLIVVKHFLCFPSRVQQIQLLGRDMKGPAHDKLWNQLEAEIHLHRHKTVIRACRGRSDPKRPLSSPVGHVSVKQQSYEGCWYLLVPKLFCYVITGARHAEENTGSWPYQKGCAGQRRSRGARNLNYSKNSHYVIYLPSSWSCLDLTMYEVVSQPHTLAQVPSLPGR